MLFSKSKGQDAYDQYDKWKEFTEKRGEIVKIDKNYANSSVLY